MNDWKKNTFKEKWMKRSLILAGLIWMTAVSQIPAAWRPGEMQVRITITDRTDIQRIQQERLTIDGISGQQLTLLVIPGEFQLLKSMGYEPEILIPDLEEYSRQLLGSAELANYHDYNSTRVLVDSLINVYPTLIQKHSYGLSMGGGNCTR